jgi:hypothetical protein
MPAGRRPRSVSAACTEFSVQAVGHLAISAPERNKSLLWSCAKLASFAESVTRKRRRRTLDDLIASPA